MLQTPQILRFLSASSIWQNDGYIPPYVQNKHNCYCDNFKPTKHISPKYLRASSGTKSESREQFRDCLKNATGHLSLFSCIGSHSTGNFHVQSNQCTCWQAPGEFSRGNVLTWTTSLHCKYWRSKGFFGFFYWPLEGCYQLLEILISVFWSM